MVGVKHRQPQGGATKSSNHPLKPTGQAGKPVFSSAYPTGVGAFDSLRAEGLADPAVPAKNPAHRNSCAGFCALRAIFTAISATALTIHSKFSRPPQLTSASRTG